MTADVLSTVERDGYVRLTGGFDPDDAAKMAGLVWRQLAKRGVRPDVVRFGGVRRPSDNCVIMRRDLAGGSRA